MEGALLLPLVLLKLYLPIFWGGNADYFCYPEEDVKEMGLKDICVRENTCRRTSSWLLSSNDEDQWMDIIVEGLPTLMLLNAHRDSGA
jgi:hypothetical protein